MPNDDDPTDLIGGTEAARIFGFDRSSLSRWVAAGKLKPVRRLTERGPFLFSRADVERAARERSAAA